MRLIKISVVAALTMFVAQTAAHADGKSDYMAKCNPSKSPAAQTYCDCYFKAIDSTYGIDDYAQLQAGKMTDKAKDPKVTTAYSAAMTACAKSPK